MTILRPDFSERLDAVQAIIDPPGCPVCWGWSRHVLLIVDELTGEERFDRDEACPVCGRWVPIAHALRIVIDDEE